MKYTSIKNPFLREWWPRELPSGPVYGTLDWAFQAQPFVYVPAKDTIDLKTMDWSFQAQPFVTAFYAAVGGWLTRNYWWDNI